MNKKYITVFLCGLFMVTFAGGVCAQNVSNGNADMDSLTLEPEDTVNGTSVSSADTLEEFMITKEIEGKIKEVGDGYIIIMTEEGKDRQLIVDADTLIYVNDEISSLQGIQVNDEIFAYYVDEDGILKCDWVEITR